MKLKVFGMAASVMLFGCVTVEQFEKMSSSERADFICSRDKTVINLQSSINNNPAELRSEEPASLEK